MTMPEISRNQLLLALALLAAFTALVVTGQIDVNNDVDWTAAAAFAAGYFGVKARDKP